jgi:Ner family transcriptional regulator
MDSTRHPKKTRRQVDWNKAYIVAALHVSGNSLRKLSASKGYAETTLKAVLHAPWPKGETIIAEAIGEKPWDIWPSRYDENGKPLSGHGQRKSRGQGRHANTRATKSNANSNTVKTGCNVQGNGAV